MTYQELFDEVADLRRLVNALCVAIVEKRSERTEEHIRLTLRSPAGSHGYRLLRTGIGQYALDELEAQKQTLLEDYPDLKAKQ